MEVVKGGQLRDVQARPQAGQIGGQGLVLLVPRHVQGEIARPVVFLQPGQQGGIVVGCHGQCLLLKRAPARRGLRYGVSKPYHTRKQVR